MNELPYVTRVSSDYGLGRRRLTQRTHRAGCPNACAGIWQPTDKVAGTLPVYCRDIRTDAAPRSD